MNNSGSKGFATSILPREGEKLEPVRDHNIVLSSITIEVFHVFVFILIMWFIFGVAVKLYKQSKFYR